MKIERANQGYTVGFSTLKAGTVFRDGGHLFMKVSDDPSCGLTDYNAVDLEDGALHIFGPKNKVLPEPNATIVGV